MRVKAEKVSKGRKLTLFEHVSKAEWSKKVSEKLIFVHYSIPSERVSEALRVSLEWTMSNFWTKSQKEWRALKEVVEKPCTDPQSVPVRVSSLLLLLFPLQALVCLALLYLRPLLLFLLFLISMPDSLRSWRSIEIVGRAIIKICAVRTWIIYDCRSISGDPTVRPKDNPVLLISLSTTNLIVDRLFTHLLLSLWLLINDLNEFLKAP